MPVRKITDPTLNVLSSGKKLTVYGLPNPGQKVTFEGTQQEIIEWLRDKGDELADKAARREIENVEITRLPERWKTEMKLKDLREERLRDIFAELLTDRVGGLVADEANRILREKNLWGAAVETGIDRELVLVNVHVTEPEQVTQIGKEVSLKYEAGTIGPSEVRIKYKRKS